MEAKLRHSIDRELTIYHAAELKAEILAALEGAWELELDLSQVGEMDMAGLQILILAKREVARRGKSMHIVEHSPAVREVIDFLNLAAYFGDPLVILADETA